MKIYAVPHQKPQPPSSLLKRSWALVCVLIFVLSELFSICLPTRAFAADSVYLEVGRAVHYGDGASTHTFLAHDGEAKYIGYCGTQRIPAPPSGTYKKEALTTHEHNGKKYTLDELRAVLWFSYGAPGFDPKMWPEKNFKGQPMSTNDYLTSSHVLIAATHMCNDTTAEGFVSSSYMQWLTWNLFGYRYGINWSNVSNGDINSGLSTRKEMFKRKGEVPEGFEPYTLNARTDTQPVLVIPSVGAFKLRKSSTLPALSNDNHCYALQGAHYGIYSDEACIKLVASLQTNAKGEAECSALVAGTYYVKELAAPKGFATDATVHKVVISSGKTSELQVHEVPLHDASWALVEKLDADGDKISADKAKRAQGNASLAGAQFTVKYYDNLTGAIDGAPQKTWVFATDSNGFVSFEDPHALVAGDEPYLNANKKIVMPLGSYSIQETQAPQGYLIGEEALHRMVLTPNKSGGVSWENLDGWNHKNADKKVSGRAVADAVMRGGVVVAKRDRETLLPTALGAGSLAGASFEIENTSSSSVLVDGREVAPNEIVMTITTQEENVDGKVVHIARTGQVLPYGSYAIREIGSSKGYLFDKTSRAWQQSFSITKDGEVVDLTSAEDSVANKISREDFHFSKKAFDTQDVLSHVAFLVTSKTTGERHIIVTDENGIFNSATAAHSHNTNANDPDSALSNGATEVASDGTWRIKDASKLDCDAGVWFVGAENSSVSWESDGKRYTVEGGSTSSVDDLSRAFPYDDYRITELASVTTLSHAAINADISLKRYGKPDGDGMNLDYGTLNDLPITLETTLTSQETGEHVSAATNPVVLTDKLSFENLTPGDAYSLVGELHLVEEGHDAGVVASSTCDFTPTKSKGTQTNSFEFDASSLAGKRVVAFEHIYKDGMLIASHADIDSQAQTLTFPAIRTHAQDELTKSNIAAAQETITIKDTVTYTGLQTGKSYTVTGTLMDKATGKPAKDSSGRVIQATTSFKATEASGSVEVSFEFDGADLAGHTLVAFERLEGDGKEYAVHSDMNDEDQTIYIPQLQTTALDAADADKVMRADTNQTIVDSVAYKNLVVGKEYVLTGTLMDKSTAQAVVGKDGKALSVAQSFTPDTPDGTVEMRFELDLTGHEGAQYVVFERLVQGDFEVATHADIDDEGQTVIVPDIQTKATGEKGTKELDPTKELTVIDTISYENLLVGNQYTVTGTLMDKTTGKALLDNDGKVITVTQTFTPEKSTGTVEIRFVLNASNLAGKTLVAFERVEREGQLVAAHEDIESRDQSVTIKTPKAQPPVPEKTPLPQTGDTSGTGAFIVLLAATGVAALGVARAMKKGVHVG